MEKVKVELLSEVESLERLLYRLPANHAQRNFLQAELHKRAAGRRGEDRMNQKMAEFHSDEDYQYLRDVGLSIGDWKVQMDGLLLTKSGAVVIESKNISGRLQFDQETGEFSRVDSENHKKIMEDPIVQLNKNMRFLIRLFKKYRIHLPVRGVVVFTSKECEFLSKPKSHLVCKTYQLIDCLHAMLASFTPSSSRANLPEIFNLLHQYHSSYERNPLCEKYSLECNDLTPGILCVNCKKHTMSRSRKGMLTCTKCKAVDAMALHRTIQEYFSLISPVLTNRQLRQFCNIESPYVASRILASYNLEASGSFKNRTYSIKKDEQSSHIL